MNPPDKPPARPGPDAAGQRRPPADSGVERPSSWNPDLVNALQELLLSGRVSDQDLERELGELVERYHEAVYSELIYLLSHLRFEPAEAGAHWREILALRRTMESRLDSPIDLRVALVSYFLEVHRRLENPTVIEMKLFEQAREMAYRDELTGLYNYRYFSKFLGHEIARSSRYDGGVSLVLVDIDDFKRYNDNLGHLAGNQALVAIAGLIAGALRDVDVAARYGGEEFAVVAPETAKLGARQLAERIRKQIEAHAFPGEEAQPAGRLTASFGVAAHPADAASAEELVRRADQALYAGKSAGKNQVRLYGDDSRTYQRMAAAIGGRLRYGAERASLTTRDLSEGGVRFVTDLSLPAGALVELRLSPSEAGHEIALAGRVLQSSERAGGGCEASVRTIEIADRDRKRLLAVLEQPLPG